ncbi:DUF4230 domain-containing protein [Romboutsia sp. 1001713B170207_170306_H8]|uniref:DUF4230 domain-containing protein n=1 Tax=Romboutsia sp. 1001713B170207_170306_H8 TaxID=2787112 RepID=UPI0008215A18|nr:DUF4230 domain-containing protein [Romboutsia sp. 1001713B170207_170306_H8]SCH97716.1 Uncharacterised protein [uncultured Clostridium sp.]
MIKRKKINKVLVLLPILILIITLDFTIKTFINENNEYEDNTKVLSTISQVLDLNTVKYTYSNIVAVKKDKSINDIKIPFTEQSFIIKYEGIINGGIKPEDIHIVENTGKKIKIEVEQCRILDHYIDDEKLYVYDVKNSIFNKLDTNEILSDISKYKDEYEEKIIEEGFIDEIKVSTKTSLSNLLKNIGYEEIIITFK